MTDDEKKARLLKIFEGELEFDRIRICDGNGILEMKDSNGILHEKLIIKLSEDGKILGHYTPDPWKSIYKIDDSIDAYEKHLMSSIKGDGSNQDIKHKQKLKAVEWVKKKDLQNRVAVMGDGSLIFDNKYIYNPASLNARIKGKNKRYQMKGFPHFYNVFLKEN